MTKGELTESIMIKVNGGRVGSDTKVRREDISILLGAAINYATIAQYGEHKRETGENEFPESFISSYPNVAVQEDSDRDLRYVDIPVAILSLPKNYGFQSASPMKGNSLFVQTSFNDRQQNAYYSNSFADITLYWLEGNRVYFQNLPQITDKILLRLIQSLRDIADDEELPIPGGLEISILKIMDEWFMGQKAMPADYKPDNNGNIA